MRYLLFFVVLLFAACQKPEVVHTLDATITGAKADSKLKVEGPGYSKEFEINNGVIKDTFDFKSPGIYSFIYQRIRLQTYLESPRNVSFTGKAENLYESAVFQGEDEKIWSYFKEKKVVMKKELSPRKLYDMEPDAFLEALNNGGEKLKTFISESSLPAGLTAIEKERIDFDKKYELMIYPLAKDKAVDELPDNFKDPLAGIDFQDEAKFIENPSYAKLLSTNFSIQMSKDTSGEYEDVFMKKIAALPEGNIRNELLFGDMQYMMGPNDRMGDMFEFFKKHSTNEEHVATIQKKFDGLQSLMKGKASPGFDYENYKGGNSTLADYKGKYVYVDVWATWCGPCKAEIPSLKEKEEKYHNSNVEFVSISIDEKKDYDKWRNMVGDKELGGSQLMADQAWNSDFVKGYQINGIPRFILIDPEGNIVSADAPRPSSDKLDAKFKDLGL